MHYCKKKKQSTWAAVAGFCFAWKIETPTTNQWCNVGHGMLFVYKENSKNKNSALAVGTFMEGKNKNAKNHSSNFGHIFLGHVEWHGIIKENNQKIGSQAAMLIRCFGQVHVGQVCPTCRLVTKEKYFISKAKQLTWAGDGYFSQGK